MKKVDSDPPYLVEGIISEILKRLPVKTLIRFQSVCKHWKNIIKLPWFIADHLHHSTHQNPFLLLQYNYSQEPSHLRLLDCDMQLRQLHNTPNLIGSLSSISIVGSINGLLCLVIYQECHFSIFLSNPATKEFRNLPRPREHNRRICMGFGYSPIINDYKIVIIYHENDFSAVEVYSLNTNSWKEIALGVLQDVSLRLYCLNVSANGSIFWFGVKQGEYDISAIVSYDIAREVFTLIPFHTSIFHTRLAIYDDKPALVSLNSKDKLIELCVLEKGIDSSMERWGWIKKYTKPSPSQHMLWGTIWRNQIILCVPHWPAREQEINEPNDVQHLLEATVDFDNVDLDLYLFEITNNESKMLGIPRVNRGRCCFVFNYVEGLVPLDS